MLTAGSTVARKVPMWMAKMSAAAAAAAAAAVAAVAAVAAASSNHLLPQQQYSPWLSPFPLLTRLVSP